MLEAMRKTVIFLLIWNILLTTGLLINHFNNQQEEKLNKEICLLEEIPMEDLE